MEMNELLTLTIKYAALCWVLFNFLVYTTRWIPIEKYLCLKCLTFWITLGLTLNPFIAATAAFVGMIIDKYITTTKTLL